VHLFYYFLPLNHLPLYIFYTIIVKLSKKIYGFFQYFVIIIVVGDLMKKVVCIGHATYDITMHIPYFPYEDHKYHVKEIIECGGGVACNASALLGMWGIESYFAGTIGNDTYGNLIEKELIDANVNVKYTKKVDHARTPNSFILVNEQNGSRTLFNYTNLELNLGDMQIDEKPDFIFVDGYEFDAAKKYLEDNKDVPSLIDAGNYKENTIKLCHMVNWLVCSIGFAEGFIGKEIDLKNFDELKSVYLKLEEEFGNNVVITLGKEGSIYRSGNEIKQLGIYKVEPAVDTTGAGDIFHGAFTYCLVNGFDIEKTVRIASITSALSIKTYGGRYSINPLSSVMELYNKNVL